MVRTSISIAMRLAAEHSLHRGFFGCLFVKTSVLMGFSEEKQQFRVPVTKEYQIHVYSLLLLVVGLPEMY